MRLEAPWLVTAYLAAAGWFVTHAVDRVTKSPTLEYNISYKPGTNRRFIVVDFENLTRDQAFEDIVIALQGASGNVLSDPRLVPIQPADDGPNAPELIGDTASYRIERILPGGRVRISAAFQGPANPRLRVSSSKSSIRLLSRGWETSFARHELEYLLSIGLLGGIVLSIRATRQKEADRVAEVPGEQSSDT